MKKVSDILGVLPEKYECLRPVLCAELVRCWNEVAGEAIRANAVPERFVDGCLYVAVKDPAWVAQLTLMRSDIVKRLEEMYGNQFKDVKFSLGKFRAVRCADTRNIRVKVPPDVAGEIERILEGTGDAALKAVLRAIMNKSYGIVITAEKKGR